MPGASSPGSTTSACLVSGQATIVQLQPSSPTGNDSRMSGMRAGSRSRSTQAERYAADQQYDRLRALGQDLVGQAGDVDETPVGDAGRQEPEPDLGRDQHDRRRRFVKA